jgi:predicted transcriptional regulator
MCNCNVSNDTDILISIKPVFMNHIVERTKNHEFRKYLLPNTVQRMWLCVSSPDLSLRYIATISRGKLPGEITMEDGMGNADFNSGLKESIAAYQIMELYQLKEPLSLTQMHAKYGATFPHRFSFVSANMVNEIVLKDQIRLF